MVKKARFEILNNDEYSKHKKTSSYRNVEWIIFWRRNEIKINDFRAPGIKYDTPEVIAYWLEEFSEDIWSFMECLASKISELRLSYEQIPSFLNEEFVSIFIKYLSDEYDENVNYDDLDTRLLRIEGRRQRVEGKTKYSERLDKSESDIEFLGRIFGRNGDLTNVSLSDVRRIDESLYFSLMRKQKKGEIDLSKILTAPRAKRGAKVKALPFDLSLLDPNDIRDAALLKLHADRAKETERKRRYRAKLAPK